MTARLAPARLLLLLAAACNQSTAPLTGSLAPSYSVDFGPVVVGQQGQHTVVLANGSSSTFHITSVDPSTDPQFSASVAAGTPIPARGELTLPVTFTPASFGSQSGAIVLHTDDPAVPAITLQLSGQGVSLQCPTVTPSIVDFGNVAVGTTVTRVVTLTNGTESDCQITPSSVSGSQAAQFTVDQSGTALDVPAGGLVEINVTYAPTAVSASDSASFILSASSSNVIVDLKGSAVASCLQISPAPLSFAFVPPSDSRTLPLHLANGCGTPIIVTLLGIGDGGNPEVFALADQAWMGGILNPVVSVDLDVTFTPPMIGKYDGVVDLAVAGEDAGVRADLTGFGGGAVISCAPASLDFGTTAVGIPTSLPVTCTNKGTDVPGHPEAGLSITQLVSNNPLFSGSVDAQSLPQPVAAGESVRVDATYTPADGGATDTGTLTINSNVTDGTAVPPPVIALTGEGVQEETCSYSIVPSDLSFGQISPGRKATQSFTITNLGPNDCVVSGLVLGASTDAVFSLPNGPIVSQKLSGPASAGPDGGPGLPPPYPTSLNVPVAFSPVSAGAYTGSVQFTLNDPAAPQQTVTLSGSQGTSCFKLQPEAIDFGTIGMSNGQLCASAKRNVVGVNGCSQPVTITGVTLQTDGAYVLLVDSLPQTVPAGGSSTPFEIGFKPQAAGTYSAGILLQTDLQPTAFGAQLSGTAVDGNMQTDMFSGGPAAFPLSGTPDPVTIQLYVDGPPPDQTPPGQSSGVLIPATDASSGAVNWTYDSADNSVVPDPMNLSLASTDTVYIEYTLVCN
jgi:hypothetical protein